MYSSISLLFWVEFCSDLKNNNLLTIKHISVFPLCPHISHQFMWLLGVFCVTCKCKEVLLLQFFESPVIPSHPSINKFWQFFSRSFLFAVSIWTISNWMKMHFTLKSDCFTKLSNSFLTKTACNPSAGWGSCLLELPLAHFPSASVSFCLSSGAPLGVNQWWV